MADREFKLTLLLTAIDRASAPVNRLSQVINRVKAPTIPVLNKLSSLSDAAGVDKVQKAFGGVTDSIGNVGDAAQQSFGRLLKVLGLAGAGVYAFNREFVETAADFESVGMSLEGIYGSADKAKTAMAFLKKMTIDTPYQFRDLTETFRTMIGQGLDPMNGSLQAIVDTAAKLGKGPENMQNMALQLSQAWSKGRLLAQDSNQLAENGIAVWAVLARAQARVQGMKNPTQKWVDEQIPKLRKASENGLLGKGSIKELLNQLAIENQGGAQRMMRSFRGILSNIGDAWFFFKQRVMKVDDVGKAIEGGPMDLLEKKAQKFLNFINSLSTDGSLDRFSDKFASRLGVVLNWLDQAAPKAWNLMMRLGGVVAYVADLFGGWGNLLKVGLAAFIGGPLAIAIAGLIAACATFGATLMLTPVGWFLGALALLAAGAFLLIVKWKSVKAFFIDLWAGIIGTFRGALDLLAGVVFFKGDLIKKGIVTLFSSAWKVISTVLKPLAWLMDKVEGAGSVIGGGIRSALSGVFSDIALGGDMSFPVNVEPRMPRLAAMINHEASPAGSTPSPGASSGQFPSPFDVIRSGAAPAAATGAQRTDAHVTIDFKNTPRGTDVRPGPRNNTQLTMNLGWAMPEASH